MVVRETPTGAGLIEVFAEISIEVFAEISVFKNTHLLNKHFFNFVFGWIASRNGYRGHYVGEYWANQRYGGKQKHGGVMTLVRK